MIDFPKKKSLVKRIVLGALALAAAGALALSGAKVDWIAVGKDAVNGEASNTVQQLEDYKVSD